MSRTRNERKRIHVLWLVYNLAVFTSVIIICWYLWYCSTYHVHKDEVCPGQHYAVVEPVEELGVTEVVNRIEEEEIIEELTNYENTCAFDYEYVLRVVAAECRGEPYEGQMAVAQCILNTSIARSMLPDEVVKEKNQYASPVTNLEHIELVRDACDAVFFKGEVATDEPIRFFYSTRNGFVSNWHENNLEFVTQIGNHKFFKEK